MKTQAEMDFERISAAIHYIQHHYKNQPLLDDIAASVNVSPYHFQKLFTEWAGVSPKKFLQYITLAHAKSLLKKHQASLFDAALESGLSGSGRLHDLFVGIEAMTPGEYKNGGEKLSISYSFDITPFGKILLASTAKGICYAAFADDEDLPLSEMKVIFPKASYLQQQTGFHRQVLQFFNSRFTSDTRISLHLKGTEFQVKVWEALLKIPHGELTTYGSLAASLNKPSASRAVGSAVGDNPVAFLIPCHRVIQSSGAFGQYHWGSNRKMAMIGWEAATREGGENETA